MLIILSNSLYRIYLAIPLSDATFTANIDREFESVRLSISNLATTQTTRNVVVWLAAAVTVLFLIASYNSVEIPKVIFHGAGILV